MLRATAGPRRRLGRVVPRAGVGAAGIRAGARMGPSRHRRSAAAGRAAPCPWARPLLPASSAGAPRGERGRPWEERRGHPGLPRGPAMACVGGGVRPGVRPPPRARRAGSGPGRGCGEERGRLLVRCRNPPEPERRLVFLLEKKPTIPAGRRRRDGGPPRSSISPGKRDWALLG